MTKPRSRRDNVTGTEKYTAFIRRTLRSFGRRAVEGDLDTTALTDLAKIRAQVDTQIAETVHALRTEQGGSYSWAQIGDALGMTRAAAHKKFGSRDTDARRVGGQPTHLR